MLCSMQGCVHDVLGFVHPSPFMLGWGHNGVGFSTVDVDNDIATLGACAPIFNAGWWYTSCSVWGPTLNSPTWCGDDLTYYTMENVHIMMKLQWPIGQWWANNYF